MTRDEIIAFARDSGVIDFRDADLDEHVADFVDFLCKLDAAARAEEREACAEEAESAASDDNKYDIASAIRSRGNHA